MKKAFTLAEVLITLAIIGVVAALTIPSVVANTQQQEFKTGLKKAVSVLNSAITMNMAIDGETPYENRNLYYYLGRHMSIMKSMAVTPTTSDISGSISPNAAFYTTDGMRFEFMPEPADKLKLYENNAVSLRGTNYCRPASIKEGGTCGRVVLFKPGCGSYGLSNNPDNTTLAPCLVVVDVNGDRKPFPKNASCFGYGREECARQNIRKYSDPTGRKLTDTFSIMITDKQAIPYGQAAQKAMYEAQK